MPFNTWGDFPVLAMAKFAYAHQIYQTIVTAFGGVPASQEVILEEATRTHVDPLTLLARKRKEAGEP